MIGESMIEESLIAAMPGTGGRMSGGLRVRAWTAGSRLCIRKMQVLDKHHPM